MKFLTKSLYMRGQQCPRLLWFSSRHQLPELSLYDKHKFAQGREFEKYVKKLFPDGIDLGNLGKMRVRSCNDIFFSYDCLLLNKCVIA